MAILMTSFQCHTTFSISINIFISVNNTAGRNLTRHKNNPHVSKAIIDMLRVIFNFSLPQLIPDVIFSPVIAILTRPAPVSYCLQGVREVHWFDDRKYMLLGIKPVRFNLPLM